MNETKQTFRVAAREIVFQRVEDTFTWDVLDNYTSSFDSARIEGLSTLLQGEMAKKGRVESGLQRLEMKSFQG